MIFAVTFGLGCAAFTAMIALTMLSRHGLSHMARIVMGLYAITALWALLVAVQTPWMPGVAHFVETIKTWAWLQFVALVLVAHRKSSGLATDSSFFRYGLPALCLVACVNDAIHITSTGGSVGFSVLQMSQRVVLSAIGVFMVENLVRNTVRTRRWYIAPFAWAVGMLFAYDLFVFAEGLFARRVDPALLAARGLVLILVTPPLILTMVRNQDWRIDLHVSRNVVFHSTTLTLGGLFLLLAGGIASVVGQVPGTWGPMLRIIFFCASILVLLAALSAETFRARIRRFLFENFFSTRYDYRVEWGQFVDALSAAGEIDSLATRSIRAIAKVVDCPGGALWLEESSGVFRLAASLNLTIEGSIVEGLSSPFIQNFLSGSSVQQLDQIEPRNLPAWFRPEQMWLGIPLIRTDHLIGFIILAKPRAGVTLNWESVDLLGLLARQISNFLSEERATRVVAESSAIIEYNKRFAFVVHDIKNLASQLGMTLANARKFIANPQFQSDMIDTIENSVARMNGLLDRLRSNADLNSHRDASDPITVAKSVISDFQTHEVSVTFDASGAVGRADIEPEALRSIFTHLLTNAVEASASGGGVKFSICQAESAIRAEITDSGPGMDNEFLHNELFSPLRSTKGRGHGIGAFQARELLRASGGDLEVVSTLGKGTTMKILLRPAQSAQAAPGASSV